jgi:hypothetical protein
MHNKSTTTRRRNDAGDRVNAAEDCNCARMSYRFPVARRRGAKSGEILLAFSPGGAIFQVISGKRRWLGNESSSPRFLAAIARSRALRRGETRRDRTLLQPLAASPRSRASFLSVARVVRLPDDDVTSNLADLAREVANRQLSPRAPLPTRWAISIFN